MKSKKDIENLICDALKENNINTNSINPTTIDKIEEEYKKLYNMLVPNNEEKELDTFNDATCIVKAINKYKVIESDTMNAKIAVDIAFSMCKIQFGMLVQIIIYRLILNLLIPKRSIKTKNKFSMN